MSEAQPQFLLPKLVVATRDSVKWPVTKNPATGAFEGTLGSVDCTAHLRTRVHPKQADWYRRDKGKFCFFSLNSKVST
jgi:hypothetical protein